MSQRLNDEIVHICKKRRDEDSQSFERCTIISNESLRSNLCYNILSKKAFFISTVHHRIEYIMGVVPKVVPERERGYIGLSAIASVAARFLFRIATLEVS
jgi:hypothetical protein